MMHSWTGAKTFGPSLVIVRPLAGPRKPDTQSASGVKPPCLIVSDDDLRAELVMIDENLIRAELSPAERASATARRKEVYEALHPETRHGAAGATGRWDAGAKLAPAFTSETAAASGRSERSVQRDARRGSRISEQALALVRSSQLDRGAYTGPRLIELSTCRR